MKIPRLTWLCHAVCLFVFSTASLYAQSGCIEDSTHAVIPNARVVLSSVDAPKSVVAPTKTDDKGGFAFTGAPSGGAHLSILAESFAPFEKDVESGDVGKIVLEVEPIRNSIVVTAT